LFENAICGAWGQIIAQLAGNGNKSRYIGVFELSMATASSSQIPPIRLDELDNFFDFHGLIVAKNDADRQMPPLALNSSFLVAEPVEVPFPFPSSCGKIEQTHWGGADDLPGGTPKD
jgi:hypothetical protein